MTTDQPDLQDAKITAFLAAEYGLQVAAITFLPIGYQESVVYRVVADDATPYFLKLKRDVFEETAVRVPVFLHEQGVQPIIVPVLTRSGQRWAQLDGFHVILYPFVEGHNAFTVPLTERQWADFGAALKGIHTTVVPPELRGRLPRETYTPRWRDMLTALLERAPRETFSDPAAAQLAALLAVKADELRYLVRRAKQLGAVLHAQPLECVLCHSDIHAGNLLIDASDRLYMVDWDNPILAPKERDLMFIGGGVGSAWYSVRDEALFYQGYGRTPIDPVALAYYRFERIVQDLALFVEQLLFTDTGGDTTRARIAHGIERFFQPHDVVEMAYQAERALPPELLTPD